MTWTRTWTPHARAKVMRGCGVGVRVGPCHAARTFIGLEAFGGERHMTPEGVVLVRRRFGGGPPAIQAAYFRVPF